ncbi:YybH family protein [Pedobacter steynii]|uniref:DUF4440 domain-containing protein n=1 Tax=Pedobacter steynii TaxID=430522 RepID=A0A1D7QPG7_9SPHI|nr:DUF4440 domain-containing protein [Pedobacter steynii]AOM80573.1 DUF4440 domain-containing protein [Pedobacter steynii]
MAILLFITLNLVTDKTLAQSQTDLSLDEAKREIASSNNLYFQAFVKGDSSIFINRYAEDCLIMVPNAKAMKGHRGALEFFKIAYDQIGLRDGEFITTMVYGLGNGYVAEEGIWKSYNKDHVLFDHGKFLVLWKKTDQGWKMFRDSFSSDNKLN